MSCAYCCSIDNINNQVLRKYSDKTVAKDLVQELESYNVDALHFVASGLLLLYVQNTGLLGLPGYSQDQLRGHVHQVHLVHRPPPQIFQLLVIQLYYLPIFAILSRASPTRFQFLNRYRHLISHKRSRAQTEKTRKKGQKKRTRSLSPFLPPTDTPHLNVPDLPFPPIVTEHRWHP